MRAWGRGCSCEGEEGAAGSAGLAGSARWCCGRRATLAGGCGAGCAAFSGCAASSLNIGQGKGRSGAASSEDADRQVGPSSLYCCTVLQAEGEKGAHNALDAALALFQQQAAQQQQQQQQQQAQQQQQPAQAQQQGGGDAVAAAEQAAQQQRSLRTLQASRVIFRVLRFSDVSLQLELRYSVLTGSGQLGGGWWAVMEVHWHHSIWPCRARRAVAPGLRAVLQLTHPQSIGASLRSLPPLLQRRRQQRPSA